MSPLEPWQVEAQEIGSIQLREDLRACADPTILRVEVLDRPHDRKRKRQVNSVFIAEHVPSQCCVTAVDREQAIDLLVEMIMVQARPG